MCRFPFDGQIVFDSDSILDNTSWDRIRHLIVVGMYAYLYVPFLVISLVCMSCTFCDHRQYIHNMHT